MQQIFHNKFGSTSGRMTKELLTESWPRARGGLKKCWKVTIKREIWREIYMAASAGL